MREALENQIKLNSDKFKRDMKKKGVNDNVNNFQLGNWFQLFEAQIKELRINIEAKQKSLKESRTNADVANCKAEALEKTLESENTKLKSAEEGIHKLNSSLTQVECEENDEKLKLKIAHQEIRYSQLVGREDYFNEIITEFIIFLYNFFRLNDNSKCKICANKIPKKEKKLVIIKELQDQIAVMQKEREEVKMALQNSKLEKEMYLIKFFII